MKNIIAVVFVLTTSSTMAETWIKLNINDPNAIKIIDKDSIIKKNGLVYYRMKDMHRDGSYSINYFEHNCLGRKRSLPKMEQYSSTGEKLTTTEYHNLKWHSYQRNEASLKLESILC